MPADNKLAANVFCHGAVPTANVTATISRCVRTGLSEIFIVYDRGGGAFRNERSFLRDLAPLIASLARKDLLHILSPGSESRRQVVAAAPTNLRILQTSSEAFLRAGDDAKSGRNAVGGSGRDSRGTEGRRTIG